MKMKMVNVGEVNNKAQQFLKHQSMGYTPTALGRKPSEAEKHTPTAQGRKPSKQERRDIPSLWGVWVAKQGLLTRLYKQSRWPLVQALYAVVKDAQREGTITFFLPEEGPLLVKFPRGSEEARMARPPKEETSAFTRRMAAEGKPCQSVWVRCVPEVCRFFDALGVPFPQDIRAVVGALEKALPYQARKAPAAPRQKTSPPPPVKRGPTKVRSELPQGLNNKLAAAAEVQAVVGAVDRALPMASQARKAPAASHRKTSPPSPVKRGPTKVRSELLTRLNTNLAAAPELQAAQATGPAMSDAAPAGSGPAALAAAPQHQAGSVLQAAAIILPVVTDAAPAGCAPATIPVCPTAVAPLPTPKRKRKQGSPHRAPFD